MKAVHNSDLNIPVEEETILRLPMAEIGKAPVFSHPVEVRRRPSFGLGSACRIEVKSSGHGYWDFVQISDDIFLTVTEAVYTRAETIVVQGEDLFKLRFLVSGSIRWPDADFDTGGERHHVAPCTVISFHPDGADTRYEMVPDEPVSMITLHCKKALVRRIFGAPGYALATGSDRLSTETRLVDRQLPLTPKMQLCVNEILSSPYSNDTRLYFAKAKCIELLCIVAGLLEEQEEPNPSTVDQAVLSRKDVENLHLVRDLLGDNLTRWYSSDELCRWVGLNTKKLKYGFKKLFGKTPYRYAVEIRMETAFKALKEDNLSVSEVAYAVGYNYPANFTTAFKKHFGFTPQTLRGQIEFPQKH